MIASPGDVAAERNVIREIITEWNNVNADSRRTVLLSIGWETHSVPEMGNRPQAIINKQILGGCDLLVGVFWTRLGTETGAYRVAVQEPHHPDRRATASSIRHGRPASGIWRRRLWIC